MMASTGRIGSTERRELTAVFFWSLASLVALYLVFAHLLRREHRRAEEMQASKQLLATYEQKVEGKSIAERILAERKKKQYLLDEWKRYSNLLEIGKTGPANEKGDPEEAARIDFKVALFNAREKLVQRAKETGTKLPTAKEDDTSSPSAIGISESIGTDEDTTVRLLQLAAVQKLVGFALDLKVQEITEIEAMKPEPVPVTEMGEKYLDQYPVRLKMRCSLTAFVQFLAQVIQAQHFFTIANVFAEKTSKEDPDLLDVTVVLNALILKEKEP